MTKYDVFALWQQVRDLCRSLTFSLIADRFSLVGLSNELSTSMRSRLLGY